MEFAILTNNSSCSSMNFQSGESTLGSLYCKNTKAKDLFLQSVLNADPKFPFLAKRCGYSLMEKEELSCHEQRKNSIDSPLLPIPECS